MIDCISSFTSQTLLLTLPVGTTVLIAQHSASPGSLLSLAGG